MGAATVRASKAYLEIVAKEKVKPAFDRVRSLVAGLASSVKRVGANIGSSIGLSTAAAATQATGRARSRSATGAATTSAKGNAAIMELSASLKAMGQAGKIASEAIRGMAEISSKLSTSGIEFQKAFEGVVTPLRLMTIELRKLGPAADRFYASAAQARGFVLAANQMKREAEAAAPKSDEPGGGGGRAAQSGLTGRTSFGQLSAAASAFGRELKAVGSGLTTAGQAMERAGRFAQSLSNDMRRVGLSMKLAGIATLGFVAASVRSFVKIGSDAYDLSQRIGITAEAWSELSYYAAQAGTTSEALELSLRKMQDTVINAAVGSEAAARSLGAIGLRAAELVGLRPEDQLERIADGIASITDPALRTSIALDLFGRNAGKLLPLLTGGAAGIREARNEARRLGVTISTTDAAAADKLGDAFVSLGAVAKKVLFGIGAAIAPQVLRAVHLTTTAATGAIGWVKANGALVTSVVAVGAALAVVGGTLLLLAPIAGAVASGVVALGTVLGLVGSAAAALATPLGVVVGLVTALGAVSVALTGNWTRLVSTIGVDAVAGLQQLRSTVVDSVSGIRAALESGDTKKASEIFWKSIEVASLQGKNSILNVWDDLMSELPTSWDQMVVSMASALSVLEAEIANLMDRGSTKIAGGITRDPAGWALSLLGPLGWLKNAELRSLGIDPNKLFQDVFNQRRQLPGARSRKNDPAITDSVLATEGDNLEARVRDRRAELEQRLAALRQERDRLKAPEKADDKAARAAREDEIAKKLAELNATIAAAKSAVPNPLIPPKGAPSPEPDGPTSRTASLGDQIRRLMQAGEATTIELQRSSTGTFAGSRASGLGSGVVERMARATEKAAKNTEQLAEILRALQGLDFSFGE